MGKERFIFLNQMICEAKWSLLYNCIPNSEAETEKGQKKD